MKVTKTVKIEMTEKEKEALITIYRMLLDLEYEEETAVAEALCYRDLEPMRTDLAYLYEFCGENIEDLK